ncbi:hypothetical protein AEA09_06165 [Lysinibacillus contaminans]|uniref:HTH tetR-type domain-containing protein n=1 Tax=Lysinibacillus contaminans TaxID=1293441 RepID=A0ABR5JZT4_9BACI|nr:TetR/AcrR family transcriptional regulator [Lysinibacillus contaminans]KOS68177.1 hypothetical protein AEA09_06165 [Lysinibacillus contaminans]
MADFQYLDRRVQRTKLDLYDAFFELLKEKKYEQITIKDMIERAGYSRATFYSHYKKKDDLLHEIIDFLFRKLKKVYRQPYVGKKTIEVQYMVNEPIYTLKHLQEYRRYYQGLLGGNIQIDFSERMKQVIIQLYKDDFDLTNGAMNNDVMNRYTAYGIIGLIIDWIIADFPIESEEFSKLLVQALQFPIQTVRIMAHQK